MPMALHTLLLAAILLLSPPVVLATCACHDIAKLLPGRVLLPNSSGYKTSISSYFFLNSRQSPKCIVAPTNAAEVSKIIKKLGVRENNQVAIRSGGHTPNRGFANTDSGVTLDLRGLNKMALQGPNDDVVSVGTGALWRDVYATLDPINRTVVGARVASVGVGGFLTGGGLSFFSPKYGFGCDNVVNMEVVLANGAIVNANATSHPDLFRALKGGQGNFGIVTRFDLIAHLAAFESFKAAPYDGFAEIEQTFVYFGALKAFSSTNNMFYTKSVVNASALKFFSDVQPQTANTMRISNTSAFAEEIEKFQPTDQFASYSTLSFRMAPGILPRIYKQWKDATTSLSAKVPNVTSVLTFQDIPPPPSANAPKNSFPFAPDSTPHKDNVLVLFSFYWSHKEESALVESTIKSVTGSVQELVGNKVGFKYLNYAAAWQDPIGSYGEEINKALARVARTYDPNRFFQRVVSGGFKLKV
ncbi:hypothetical protein ACCO45_006672 [Purpureocillium lilacinum]|uniref:Uncharacterized protein n=1 Tax=Purpureocillium lilacinum TaxID=33203 RepID=A0ACC4DQ58_PURLI